MVKMKDKVVWISFNLKELQKLINVAEIAYFEGYRPGDSKYLYTLLKSKERYLKKHIKKEIK